MSAKTFEEIFGEEPHNNLDLRGAWAEAKNNITLEEALKVVAQEIIRRAKDLLGGEIEMNQYLPDHPMSLDIALNEVNIEICVIVGKLLKWKGNKQFEKINKLKKETFKERRKNDSI